MKNKKGFTLVELVAVIALLAVILLIVLPNIVNIFNTGKKTAFSALVQDIYKQAEKDYSINHTLYGVDTFFCDQQTRYYVGDYLYDILGTECIPLSFNDETANYFVIVNSGKVYGMIVGNDEYCYDTRLSYDGASLNVDTDDIKEGHISFDGIPYCEFDEEGGISDK